MAQLLKHALVTGQLGYLTLMEVLEASRVEVMVVTAWNKVPGSRGECRVRELEEMLDERS